MASSSQSLASRAIRTQTRQFSSAACRRATSARVVRQLEPFEEQYPPTPSTSASPSPSSSTEARPNSSRPSSAAAQPAANADETILRVFSRLGSTQTSTWKPHQNLHQPPSPQSLTLSALMAAGAHLGHASSLAAPAFLPYTYGTRAGLSIIDLDQTLPLLRRAANVTRAIAEADGLILFVGTRSDALGAAARKAATRLGSNGFHIDSRWLPGLLTNPFEILGEQTVRETNVKPDLVVFLNPLDNLKAIRECGIARVPTVGIIDSNVDPRLVMYPIPANDESTRTAELIAGTLSVAGREGVKARLEKQRIETERLEKERSQMKEEARRDEAAEAELSSL
ncbi:ribosomal protein S2 [Clavulina sp. PMI_390]|nr:ribosomal protein S2 [Clavulina sp. PMI_390]